MSPRSPLVVLAALAAMGVTLKAGRIWGIADGAGDWGILRMFPASIGRDLVTAGVIALGVWLIALGSRRLAALAAGFFCTLFGLFALGNAISYAVSQSPITLQRLRGDEGVTLMDLWLLDSTDWLPGIAVFFFGAAAAIIAAGLARTRPARTTPILLAATFTLAGASEVAHQGSTDRVLARVAETPVGVFASSVRTELDPPPPPLRPLSRYPKFPPADAERAAALWAQVESASTTRATPTTAPQRAPGEKKNAIVMLAETLSFKHSSFGNVHDTTPHMKRRAADGLTLTNAYSPYCLSIQAIYGTACSDWPMPDGKNIAGVNPRIDCGEISQALAPSGIKSGLFHAGNFGFYDKLAFLGRRSYDVEVDAQVLAAKPGANWETSKWGIDDAAMVDAVLEWIDTLPKEQRFFSFLIPISAHYPYHLWAGHEAKFPGSSKRERYHSAIAYLDETFERLMKGLEARGILDDTAIIVVGDHGESVGEQVHESSGNRLSYQTHAHVPMFVVAKDVVPPQTSNRVVGLIDIAPTVLDLLGLPADPRHHGRSIFAPDWRERRSFLAGKGDGLRVVGFVDQDTKFLVNTDTLEPQIYDLREDPHELVNVAAARPEQVAEFTDAALAWRDWQIRRIRRTPSLGDEIDLHAGAWKDATFTITDPSGSRTCKGDACAPAIVREQARTAGAMRNCLVLTLPPDGAMKLEARDAPWVKEISQLRIARIDRQTERADVLLSAVSDGRSKEVRLHAKLKIKRLEVVRPRESIEISVTTAGIPPKLCLTLGETAWRNTRHDRSTGAGRDTDQDTADQDADTDDEHANAMRNRN